MRKIKRGGGPGGSSEWILEEKGQPHGCAKAPSGSPGKEQKGQSQRVGRWRGERPPALCKCGGERDCQRKWETQKRHFRPPGRDVGSRCLLLRREMGVTSVWMVFGAAGPQALANCRGPFPGVSSFFHWPPEAFATCPVLTGVAGGFRECGVHRLHLPEGVGPVLCFLICMLRSVGGNHSVPPAPGAQSWCPQAPGPTGLEGPLEHVRHILLVVWAALPGLHVSTLCSESSTPLGMARPPPRPQSLPPTPAHPLLADQVLDISPLLLSSHPASAPTQVQSADFFKKGNLKSGLHFCVKWPDF